MEELIRKYPELAGIPVWETYELLLERCCKGGKVLICGNGGSAADAEHIVGELMKGFKLKRALSLVTRDEADAYFHAEDQEVTMAEYQMM